MKKNEKIKKIRKIIIYIIIFGFAAFNNKIMPERKELTELELTKVIGMDKINEDINKVQQTIVRVPIEEQSGKSEGGSASSGGTSGGEESSKILTVKGISFSDVIRTFQTYANKRLAGSHIKFMILGENMCNEELIPNLDFNFRHYDVRLNADIYIAKESSAEDFLVSTTKNSYNLDEKIANMENNNSTKSVSNETTIIELMSKLAEKDSTVLVPTLEVISEKGEQKTDEQKEEADGVGGFKSAEIDSKNSTETFFDFRWICSTK